MKRLVVLAVLFSVAAACAGAQEVLPVQWGQSKAALVEALGEPDEDYARGVEFYDERFFGWKGNLMVFLDADQRVERASYQLAEASEAAWIEIVSELTERFGSPSAKYYVGNMGKRTQREKATQDGQYGRKAVWIREDAQITVSAYVSPDGSANSVGVTPLR